MERSYNAHQNGNASAGREDAGTSASAEKTPEKVKLVKLPLARVKNIMKMDPDCHIITQDAVFLATKAAELFIEMLSKATYEYTTQTKRKTVMKQDLEKVIKSASNLCFMDGMLESM